MSLRYFQPSFGSPENYVPKYAPLPLDAVQYGAERAAQTYELGQQALDAYSEQHQAILSQLTPQNRAQAQQILERDSQLIDRLSDPDGDIPYQDILPTLRRKARQSMQEIQPYIQDSQQIRAFQERMEDLYDKGHLTPNQKMAAMLDLSQYEGLQFDESGRTRGFQAPNLVRTVDVHGRIQDFMKLLEDGHTQALVAAFDGDEAFVREITQKYRTDTDIQTIYQMIANRVTSSDPEAREFLLAEHRAENRIREASGEEPLPFFDPENLEDSFLHKLVEPYVTSQAMPRQTERLRANPRFNKQDLINLPLSHSVLIGTAESDVMTPRDLRGAIGEIENEYKIFHETIGNEFNNLGVRVNYDENEGKYVVLDPIGSDGLDHSEVIAQRNLQLKNIRQNAERLRQYEQDAREHAGLGDWSEEEAKYEDALQRAFDTWVRPQGQAPSPKQREVGHSAPASWENFQNSQLYENVMQNVSGAYKKYVDYLRDNASGGHTEAPVTSLEGRAKDFLSSHMRLHGRHNPVYDAMTRKLLTDDDRKKLDFQKSEFVGVFPEEGKMWASYNMFDKDGDFAAFTILEAPPETQYYMLQSGMYDEFDITTFNAVTHLSDAPGGVNQTTLTVKDRDGKDVPGYEVDVMLLPRGQQTPLKRYHVVVHGGAQPRRYEAKDMGDVAQIYRELSIRINRTAANAQ